MASSVIPFLTIITLFVVHSEGLSLQDRNKIHRRSLLTQASILLASTTIGPPCHALSPNEASRDYDTYASTYDLLDGSKAVSSKLGIDEARTLMVEKARGNVLEIGVGTGLNLDRYQPKNIKSLTIVDISAEMLSQAKARLSSLEGLEALATIKQVDATNDLVSSFGADQFDTVVDSFSLCVMGNEGARRCLEQISRVVKESGRVLLLENTRSSNTFLGAYQDLTADAAASFGGKGCVYNQDVRRMIESTGSLQIQKETLFSAGIFRLYECIRV